MKVNKFPLFNELNYCLKAFNKDKGLEKRDVLSTNTSHVGYLFPVFPQNMISQANVNIFQWRILTEKKGQNWFQRQFIKRMNPDSESGDLGYVAAIAAAAVAAAAAAALNITGAPPHCTNKVLAAGEMRAGSMFWNACAKAGPRAAWSSWRCLRMVASTARPVYERSV